MPLVSTTTRGPAPGPGLLAAVFCAALMGWGVAAHASSDRAATEQVAVRLLASHQVVQAGQKLLVGIEQRIAPHWHTYWRNPGDSGEATTVEWKLPAGAWAGPLLWPTPQRVDVGPLTNYGYAGITVLLTEIALPPDLPTGKATRIATQVAWLVCKDECIPQSADLVLDLPVAATARASEDAPRLTASLNALPQVPQWHATVHNDDTGLRLAWPSTAAQAAPHSAQFFPQSWGWIQHPAPQTLRHQGGQWQLSLTPGDALPKTGGTLDGVLVLQTPAGTHSFSIQAPVQTTAQPGSDSPLSLWLAVGLALLGGMVLNLMPCVFPILSIKAFSLVQQAHGSLAVARRHGLAYTAGALVSFSVLAVVLIAFKAAGNQVGWGFQFQSPVFVGLVAAVLFAVGLSLSGVFTVGAGFAGLGSQAAQRSGYGGSFFSGVLAAVVATPCTAPFMGAAVAYALAQPAWQLLLVFLSLGLGLAIPYLLLSWWPALQTWLPRPGPWMETLKQALAFPMYGAAIWLVWVIAQQSGADGVLLVLTALGLVAVAAWAYQGSSAASGTAWRRTGTTAAVLATVLACGSLAQLTPTADTTAARASPKDFEPYTPQRLATLRAQGTPVFVNLTAAWCISCLVNERMALSQPAVRQAFKESGVAYLKGDWTQKDPLITELLTRHGRSGVPLYLYYPAGADAAPVVLPQILTPGLVTSVLKPPSHPPT